MKRPQAAMECGAPAPLSIDAFRKRRQAAALHGGLRPLRTSSRGGMCPALSQAMSGVALVVDEDASMGDALRAALAGNPVGIVMAGDIGTAKAMLDTQRFCGLVLDIVMDGGRGMELLDYMRARNLAIPTVIVSDGLTPALRETLDNDTVKLLFHKPIEPRLLASIVLGLCGIAV